MISNREMSRRFALYAELLLPHRNERLAALLSRASYRLRNLIENVTGLSKEGLLKLFSSCDYCKADTVVHKLQKVFKTKRINLRGEMRRQAMTVGT